MRAVAHGMRQQFFKATRTPQELDQHVAAIWGVDAFVVQRFIGR